MGNRSCRIKYHKGNHGWFKKISRKEAARARAEWHWTGRSTKVEIGTTDQDGRRSSKTWCHLWRLEVDCSEDVEQEFSGDHTDAGQIDVEVAFANVGGKEDTFFDGIQKL